MRALLLLWLLQPFAARAAITIVQSASVCSTSGSGVGTESVSLSMTAGNTGLLFISYFNQSLTPSTVKLSDGTTSGVQDGGGQDDATINSQWIYRFTNLPSGISGATVTQSNASYPCLVLVEVSGLDSSPLVVTSAPPHSPGAALDWTTNAMSPTAGVVALIIAVVYNGSSNSIAANSPYTLIAQQNGTVSTAVAYRFVTTNGTSYAPAGTVSSVFTSALGAVYKPAPSARNRAAGASK